MQPPNGLKASTASRHSCQRKIAAYFSSWKKKVPLLKNTLKDSEKKSWILQIRPENCTPEFTWIYHLFVIEPRCDLVTPKKKTSGTTWKASRIWPNLTPKRIAIYAIYLPSSTKKWVRKVPYLLHRQSPNTARSRTFSFWSLGPNLKTFGVERALVCGKAWSCCVLFGKREIHQ